MPRAQVKEFTSASIAGMQGGGFGAQLDLYLRMLLEDCRQRPQCKEKRKLTIVMTVEPVKGGTPDDVWVGAAAKPSIPAAAVAVTQMRLRDGKNKRGEPITLMTFTEDLTPQMEFEAAVEEEAEEK